MSDKYNPETIGDFAAGWPPEDIDRVQVSKTRLFVSLVCARIGTLLDNWTGYAGQVIVVNSTSTGPVVAGLSGLAAILFGNKGVRGFKAGSVPITASTVLTDNDHGGATLMMKNTSAVTLTIAPSADPATGCGNDFVVKILRCVESTAAVRIVFSSCTNRNPDGHTRVKAGRPAFLQLDGANVYFDGYTEA